MSIHIMAAVWGLAGLSSGQKLVLLCLADNANDDGVCWPSVPNVARRCCLDARSVTRIVQQLESLGCVAKDARSGRSTVYRVTPGGVAPPTNCHPCQDVTPGTASPPPPTNCHPEPSAEPSRGGKHGARAGRVSLAELSVDHVADWLARKRGEGRYVHHDEHFVLDYFKNYCQSKGKRYDDYAAGYRNAFTWERCQPKPQPNPAVAWGAGRHKPNKADRARTAVVNALLDIGAGDP